MGDRELVLEILKRMREAEAEAKLAKSMGRFDRADIWTARARAFNECYTELKGRGYDKPRPIRNTRIANLPAGSSLSR